MDPELFYNGKYAELLLAYERVQNKTSQDILNGAISKFLLERKNPLAEFEKAEQMIRSEAVEINSWFLHPSWATLMYNKALFFFNTGKYRSCADLLDYIWEHQKFISKFTLLCIALLTVELSLRSSHFSQIEAASNFLAKYFPKGQNVTDICKGAKQSIVTELVQKLETAKMRRTIQAAIATNNESTQTLLRDTLVKFERSVQEAKGPKKQYSLLQLMPLASTALFLEDNTKYKHLLDMAKDQTHPAVLNNQGVFEMMQNRYAAALLQFSKALQKRSSPSDVLPPYQQIMYNAGVALLFKQKPRKAFKYLYSIIPIVPDFPYLWLRLAECCVSYFKLRVAKLRRRRQLTSIVAKKLFTSTRTYTILPMSDSRLFARYRETDELGSLLTLEFAEKCAMNAIRFSSEKQGELKQNATVLAEYVCLELGDYKKTELLSRNMVANNVELVKRFLSRIYAAQATYMLNDWDNSLGFLKPIMVEVQFLNKRPEYAIMLYQTAARVYEASKDLEKSLKYLNKSMNEDPNCREVILAKVAVDLQNKRTQNALSSLDAFKPK